MAAIKAMAPMNAMKCLLARGPDKRDSQHFRALGVDLNSVFGYD